MLGLASWMPARLAAVHNTVHVDGVRVAVSAVVLRSLTRLTGLLQEKIAQAVNEKKIESISDMRDESTVRACALFLNLKRDAVPQVVLNNLYRRTQLQSTAIIDPAWLTAFLVCSLFARLLRHYIDHQIDVVRRRAS